MKNLSIAALNLFLASSLYAEEGHQHGHSAQNQDAMTMHEKQQTHGERSLAEPYLKIQDNLSKDTIEGLSAAATELAKRASKMHADDSLGNEIKEAAEHLSKSGDIKSARTHFKKLSQLMVRWQSTAKPKGVKVAYCSMAKGSWLQKEGEIANPYYGSKMLKCGEWVN